MAGSLTGKTLFISGASRGIGLSIALRAAADGANIVIAAKTAEPHPSLPGTIYTAAEEVEKAGGKCLPCVVDIRDESAVENAVAQTVDKFGGVDILVNNASAIHMTGTVETPMKRFDLMMGVNTRGTFLCSKYCIPHLMKSANPHILNISPPLNMNPRWFKDHVAYTMAKYGMSMCVLGMSEELKDDGIAVNALWPRTAIWTAAMAMLGGGDAIKPQCRKPEIMADAAHSILTKGSRLTTGNFFIDDEVLASDGIKDIEKYAFDPKSELLPDFFLDGQTPEQVVQQMESAGADLKFKPKDHINQSASELDPQVENTFKAVKSLMSPELISKINGVFEFQLKDGSKWHLDLKNGNGSAGEGVPPHGQSDCTMICTSEDFVKMFNGKLNPTRAFMSGKLKMKGNLGLAMKLEKLMKKMNS